MKISLNGYFYLLTFGLLVAFCYAFITAAQSLPGLAEGIRKTDGSNLTPREIVVSGQAGKKEEKKEESEGKKEDTEAPSKPEDAPRETLLASVKSPEAMKPAKPVAEPKVEPGEKKEESEKEKDAGEDRMKPVADADPSTALDSNQSQPAPPQNEPVFRFVLPTDNREIFGDPTKFYMHTNRYIDGVNTRPWTGGKYGFVRNQLSTRIGTVFTRLHEGIDIRPVKRDDSKVPLDNVYTMADGKVAYVNPSSSRSNYGRYIVVEHAWPCGSFYSLYAHLASIGVKSGDYVKAGDVLGRLGYSGAGIDRERAHVHVELAMMLSEKFNDRFSPGNGHLNFNGINLIGLDVERFIQRYEANPNFTMREFLDEEEPYYKVRTSTNRKPGILDRHPWLGINMEKEKEAKCWEMTFANTGVPLSIEPFTEKSYRYPIVSWVKTVNTNHSYMTAGRLLGSKDYGKLSSRGHRFIKLISEAF